MAEETPADHPSVLEAQARLHQLALVLREAEHLEPEVRASLADLMIELGQDLAPTGLSPDELTHLTSSATHLVDELQQPYHPGVVEAARARLAAAVVGLEVKAPLTAGLIRRMLDALAALGI